MLTRILTVALFLGIMGLLIAQRFSLPASLETKVVQVYEESNFHTGELLERGQRIVTPGSGYLAMTIGNATTIYLAANTEILLERLYEDEIIIHLTKGRILVNAQSRVPLTIKTNFTKHVLFQDVATFVNYDFLETIHVIPLSGSVQVSVDSTSEQLLTPVPLSIHETEPVSFEKLEVNLAAGDAADFYKWTGILTQE